MTPESIQTRGLGNPNRGIDDLGTKVGKGSHCGHGRKRNDPLAFPVVVGQHARSVSGESEPGAVAARVAPTPGFVEPRAEAAPDGMGNPAVLLQELAEPLGRNGHGVGPGSLHLRIPLQVRGTCSGRRRWGLPAAPSGMSSGDQVGCEGPDVVGNVDVFGESAYRAVCLRQRRAALEREVSGDGSRISASAVATIRLPMLIGCRRSSPEARMIALKVAG